MCLHTHTHTHTRERERQRENAWIIFKLYTAFLFKTQSILSIDNWAEDLLMSVLHCFSIIHIDLPKEASADCVQFRWWQPKHSGLNADQWAIDQIQLSGYKDLTLLQDDFEVRILTNCMNVFYSFGGVVTDSSLIY